MTATTEQPPSLLCQEKIDVIDLQKSRIKRRSGNTMKISPRKEKGSTKKRESESIVPVKRKRHLVEISTPVTQTEDQECIRIDVNLDEFSKLYFANVKDIRETVDDIFAP